MKTLLCLTSPLAAICVILTFTPVQNCPAATTNLTSVADTCLFQHNPDNNLGGDTYTIVGTIGPSGGGGNSRALYKYDVASSLPSGATVASATLSLAVPTAQATGLNFNLHRVLKDWGEGTGAGGGDSGGIHGAPANAGEATWNARFYPSTLWTGAGGLIGSDYLTAPSATAAMGSTTLVFSSAAMAADVQAWLDNTGTNFGWLVIIANEATQQTASHLGTREGAGNAPVLTVVYTVPTPPAPPNLFNLAQVGNQIRFSFNGESGRSYVVQFRDSLTTGDWNVLTNIPTLAANATLHITNDVSPGPRFFRARTP